MLVSLAIKDFAIVHQLEVYFHQAMTTITGETGAGKSIAIDALSLALGERGESGMVRANANKSEIIATFDITNLPQAQQWLSDNDLQLDDECILRRVISKEGRSRGYINGTPVPVAQLKILGNLLVSIHGQHAHQLLTKPEHQRNLLDEYANNTALLTEVQQSYKNWQTKLQQLNTLQQQQHEFSAQKQLLEYQVEELESAELEPDEYTDIEQEHKRLHHAQTLLADSSQALDILYENDSGNAYSAMQNAINLLHKVASLDEHLTPTIELLDSALIQLEEGSRELRSYIDHIELNPERLFEIEQRLNLLMDLSRKHQIAPENLYQHYQDLSLELKRFGDCDVQLEQLEIEIAEAQQQYQQIAQQLTKVRNEFAEQLNQRISESMQELNMAGAQFQIKIVTDNDKPSIVGNDKIEFLVSANPGQPLQPLAKVASGGELSRISLAIQVIIAQRVTTPTLLFDEVDVGVSGPTASAVGKLMKKLSQNTQVLCVTHLPQVACFGHQQHFVQKFTENGTTQTNMNLLSDSGRVDELARLLGGDKISATTKANAQELLTTAQQF